MLLYATVTSERASKGQGGQKYLDIVIRNEEFTVIGNLFIKPDNTVEVSLQEDLVVEIKRPKRIWTRSYLKLKQEETKGNKKKDECSYQWHNSDIRNKGYCEKCGKSE